MARVTAKSWSPWGVIMMLLLLAMVERSRSTPLCNVDTSQIAKCLPAVIGDTPPPPTQKCCKVIRHVNMTCLCGYKDELPALGIEPARAMALPKKCGFKGPIKC